MPFSFLWDIFKFWHSRKDRKQDKEEKRLEKEKEEREKAEKRIEKVESALGISHFGDTYDIYLEIVNLSDFAIPIDDVAVNSVTCRTPCEMVFSRPFYRTNNVVELQPRRRETFILPEEKLSLDQMKELCALPPASVWLSVSSHIGEIDRISGEVLQPFFQAHIQVRENLTQVKVLKVQDNLTLELLNKSVIQERAARHPIRVAFYDWRLWQESKNVGAVHNVNRWAKGDIRYSCNIQLRNEQNIDDKLHRMRMEFRKGNVVVNSDETAFKQKTMDLPSMKWVSLDVRHGLRDKSVLDRSDSVWFCTDTIGDNVKHEWPIAMVNPTDRK